MPVNTTSTRMSMFVFVLPFLIITFCQCCLCIRNEDANTISEKPIMTVRFFVRNDKSTYPESRQSYAHKDRTNRNNDGGNESMARQAGSKFVFPRESEENSNAHSHSDELGYDREGANIVYGRQHQNTYQQNPYDSSLNTGESSQQQYINGNGIGSGHGSGTGHGNYYLVPGNRQNGNGQVVPNYQTYNDPNYLQGNYAQNYNYPNKYQPNYSVRPDPFRRPPLSPGVPLPNRYTNPNGAPYAPSPPYIPYQVRPVYHPPNYGGPPNNYRPLLTSMMNLFNNFGNQALPLASLNPFAGQFGGNPFGDLGGRFVHALEAIARNDDLQCVPKLLCEMVGDPQRRTQLPSFLSSPAVTALIAALPSTSPALIFGRAALLGFTGGETNCDVTYPRCPRHEDDLVNYLNNHRGGFFKFFNGGGTFGDDNDIQYQQQNQQYDQPQPDDQLSDSFNQPGGANYGSLVKNLGLLANLASLLRPGSQSQSSLDSSSYDQNSNGFTNIFGNLLTGLVGNRFTSRRLHKRSIEASDNGDDLNLDEKPSKSTKKKFNSETDDFHKKGNATKPGNFLPEVGEVLDEENKRKEAELNKNEDQIEGRIVNRGRQIYSQLYDDYRTNRQRVVFPIDDLENDRLSNNRGGKAIRFQDDDKKLKFEPYIRYPPYGDEYESPPTGSGNRINFQDQPNYAPFYNDFSENVYRLLPQSYTTKMIFPDRTGTGNLRFDNDQFYFRDRDDTNHNRVGKILNRPSYSSSHNYYQHNQNDNNNNNRYDPYTERPPYYGNSGNSGYYTTTYRPVYHQYEYTTQRPSYSRKDYPNYQVNRYPTTRPKQENNNQNIYVTNSRGVVEYYINPRGEKIYV